MELLFFQGPCDHCGGMMREARKRSRDGTFRPVLRCARRGCQKYRSVRDGNEFFHYTDVNGKMNVKLQLAQILEVAYLFIMRVPSETAVTMAGLSIQTITDWYNMCREVCSSAVSVNRRGQMVGTAADPIQIDEARFAGRRKYNRGRVLAGDQPAQEVDDEAVVANHRNHGRRIDGPWVFGLCQGPELRYFIVQKRDRATLQPIIERECAAGSEIHSDEWAAYRQLGAAGFVHKTVNHQEEYVNGETGAHTQAIERSWLDAKTKIMKNMRGTTTELLQGHLDEFCWRHINRDNDDLYAAFLRDIKTVFRQQ
jgi:hypothetical protein